MIDAVINGETRLVRDNQTIAEFVTELGRDLRMVVIEYNGEILKRELCASTVIQSGDVLEIVQMMAGG
jgi:thiamine biosynthesis protein ThiS